MNDYVALGGHLFGDTSNGIDHERCRLCGLYRHHFDRNPVDCVLKSRANQDQPSPESPQDEDFGDSWAIRPQLDYSEIYSEQPCPDVYRFPSRERLLAYLDEDILPHTENGASIDTADATFCCWPPFCDWPRLMRREQRWWGRIAVRRMSHFDGPVYAGPTFTEFLERNGGLAVWPSEEVEASIERFLDGREPSVACCLASDWRFEKIRENTVWMPGHEFGGRALKGLPHQIAMVVDDLQTALRIEHSNIPVSAEAAFLESWEVLRHIAEFCGKRLARSAEATAFIQIIRPQSTQLNRYVGHARRAVHLQLPVYANYLRHWITTTDSDVDDLTESTSVSPGGTRVQPKSQGSVPGPTEAGPDPTFAGHQQSFRKTGHFWMVSFGVKSIPVRDSKGMGYIAHLLRCPNRSIRCSQLLGASLGPEQLIEMGSAGEVLDNDALQNYRARIQELEIKLATAQRNGDLASKDAAQEEMEALLQQLNGAFGMGGRRRSLSDDAERLRKSVSNAIKRAIKTIRVHHPALADHFRMHIELGNFIRYQSDGSSWEL